MMATKTAELWTVARIAEHLGYARHRVEYVIDSRGITPFDRAGIARVFDQRDVDLIGGQLRLIDAERESKGTSVGGDL